MYLENNKSDLEKKLYMCKVCVEHSGCWGPELTKKYNPLSMTFFCVENPEEDILNSIVKIESTNKFNIEHLLENKTRNVLDITPISPFNSAKPSKKEYNSLLLYVKSRDPEITSLIVEHDLIPVPPVRVYYGVEQWTLLSDEKEKFDEFYRKLRRVGNAKIKSFKPFSSEFNLDSSFDVALPSPLSDRQREVLSVFHKEGYYDWPRKTTIKEVSEKFDQCRSTVQEHLRKAESRIMSLFIEKHLK